jgi:Putative Ig domain
MKGSHLIRRTWGLPLILLAMLAGCNLDSKSSNDASAVGDNPTHPANPADPADPADPANPANPSRAAIAISGRPSTSAGVGAPYEFTPSITAGGSSQVTFSIQKKPAWLNFDAATGRITGVPAAADTGSYVGILIAATDGRSSSSLPPFAIMVSPENDGGGAGSLAVALSWTPPTSNSDGTKLTDLSGFRIYFGNTSDALTQQITIDNAGINEYVVKNLTAGVWYFALKAYNSMNEESDLSPVIQKTL